MAVPSSNSCARAWMTRAESINDAAQNYAAAIFVFDLLWLKGKDCRQQPLAARKATLERLLEKGDRIRYASHIRQNGERLYQQDEALELEGIVAKSSVSPYLGWAVTQLVEGQNSHWAPA